LNQTDQYRAELEKASQGVDQYLKSAREAGEIDQQLCDAAQARTIPNLTQWLNFPSIEGVSPSYKDGIVAAIEAGKWREIINAFRQEVRFGTGGIRGMMASDRESIVRMMDEGIDAAILKGPNTLNDLVLSLTTAGVAKYGTDQSPRLQKVVVGYDSRVRGFDFARLVAQIFLAYDYAVYLFDAPCPYPEVTYAIPHPLVKADIGVLISASHNDYRYNGYKLSCGNGSQFDPRERDDMYNNYIKNATVADIKVRKLADAKDDQLFFLSGEAPVEGFDYLGREHAIINMHKPHREHVARFLLTDNLPEQQKAAGDDALVIGFCPFHGAGIEAVPRLLEGVGFPAENILPVNGNDKGRGLFELNGLFPAFCSEAGREEQPDPGDPRSAATAVTAFKEDYGDDRQFDILIGTDPDADRCGIVVRIPENQRSAYNDQEYYLLPADDMWSLLMWYRFHRSQDEKGGVSGAEKKFIVLSHTTSDAITLLARKAGLGVIRTWVGFAALAASTRDTWDGKADQLENLTDGRDSKYVDLCHPFVCETFEMDNGLRSINEGALEQSNGFSILGGPPPDGRSLGAGGHVRDKDGLLAALLVAEIAAWAKAQGTTIIELLDKHIYLDPDIGLFATFYEPDPLIGEYPGIEGDRKKKAILKRALDYHKQAKEGKLELAGYPVKSSVIYRTGKYDAIYPPTADFQFPDEGVRLFFDNEKLQHVTIRPSGTGNSLRFHIQLRAIPTAENLIDAKKAIRAKGRAIMDDLRAKLQAPRE
jgi:phosphoglucomutase